MNVEGKATCFLKFPGKLVIKIAHLEVRTVFQIFILTRCLGRKQAALISAKLCRTVDILQ